MEGASTSEHKSALAIGGSSQPSLPAVSVSTSIPPVLGYLVGKIVNNEFVDFALLRPCSLKKVPSSEPNSGQLAKLFKVDLLPVEAFSEWAEAWAEAWAVYAGVIARKAPGNMPSLVGYFLFISSASRDFGDSGWLEYDGALRQHAAENPDVAWGEDPTKFMVHHDLVPGCPSF